MKQIILNDSEILCDKCKGERFFSNEVKNSLGETIAIDSYFCYECFGTGKLDWIETIIGKRPFRMFFKNSSNDTIYLNNIDMEILPERYVIVPFDKDFVNRSKSLVRELCSLICQGKLTFRD
jgi:hypothetical protein